MSQYGDMNDPGPGLAARQLILSAHGLESIDVLQQVADSHTQQLFLDGNAISKLDVFPTILCNLQVLDLSRNNIFKLHNCPFRNLSDLRVLMLSHNSISVIEGLEGLHSLQHLDLSHNSIDKLSGLSDLRQLRILNLSCNELEEIEDLSQHRFLESLVVSSNFISTLHGISDLLPSSLGLFDISRNAISTIQSLTFLSGLDSLHALNCEDNPFIVTAVRNNFNYRSFICFVLPAVRIVDGFRPSAIELQEGQQLFCEEGCSDISPELLQLLDVGHEQSLEKYLQSACPIELKSVSRFSELRENLDDRSSSMLIAIDNNLPQGGSVVFDKASRHEFLSKIRLMNESLSTSRDGDVSASSRWNLKTVAATVIQSHWRRKRIQSAYKSFMESMKKRSGPGECNLPAHKALEARISDTETHLAYALEEIATLRRKLKKAADATKDTYSLEQSQ